MLEERYRQCWWSKNAFTSSHISYQFVLKPLKLRNAYGTFQCTVDTTLLDILWQFTLACLDDVIVLMKKPRKIIEQVQTSVSLVTALMLYLKLIWVSFSLHNQLSGSIIWTGRIQPAPLMWYALGWFRPTKMFSNLFSFCRILKDLEWCVLGSTSVGALQNHSLETYQWAPSSTLKSGRHQAIDTLKTVHILSVILASP